MAKPKKVNYTYAVGRRRSSASRVRLFKGGGQNMVNDTPIGQYFPGIIAGAYWSKPFEITGTTGKYYVTARVVGGGKEGQMDATILAIARALAKVKPQEFKALLKKAGLLTRDSRIRQRRMVGKGGKSRRQKQSPKR